MSTHVRALAIAAALSAAVVSHPVSGQSGTAARTLVERAAEALSGLERIRAIRNVEILARAGARACHDAQRDARLHRAGSCAGHPALRGVPKAWRLPSGMSNPHVHITVEIKSDAGIDPSTVGIWDVKGGSMNIMWRQGWTRATFKAGDPITLVGHPMKDGSKGTSLFYVIMPDASGCTTTSPARKAKAPGHDRSNVDAA